MEKARVAKKWIMESLKRFIKEDNIMNKVMKILNKTSWFTQLLQSFFVFPQAILITSFYIVVNILFYESIPNFIQLIYIFIILVLLGIIVSIIINITYFFAIFKLKPSKSFIKEDIFFSILSFLDTIFSYIKELPFIHLPVTATFLSLLLVFPKIRESTISNFIRFSRLLSIFLNLTFLFQVLIFVHFDLLTSVIEDRFFRLFIVFFNLSLTAVFTSLLLMRYGLYNIRITFNGSIDTLKNFCEIIEEHKIKYKVLGNYNDFKSCKELKSPPSMLSVEVSTNYVTCLELILEWFHRTKKKNLKY